MATGTDGVAVTVAVSVAVVVMLGGLEVSGEVSRLRVAGVAAGGVKEAQVDAMRLVGREGGGVLRVELSAAVEVVVMPTLDARWLKTEGDESGLELMC